MGVVTIAAMQARSRFSLALCLAAAALLGGCAGMDAQECRDTDWAYLGQLDAMDGKQDITTRAKRHFRTCKDNGVQMDVRAYQQGWQQGLRGFCTAESGKAFAETGRKYQYGYCPAQVESAFLQGYGPVRERLDMQEEMAQLQRRIDMKKKEQREARSAKNSSSHIAYVEKDLRDLNIELLQLRFKLAQMPPK